MYNSVDWKVRRIVKTEVLSASSVTQNESVKDVGLPYTKTWVAAMINTRHSHKAMQKTNTKMTQLEESNSWIEQ